MIDGRIETEHKKSLVSKAISFAGLLIFCFWNGAFVVVSVFVIMPEILPEMWYSYNEHNMPLHYFVLMIILSLLPAICLGVFVWMKLDKSNYQREWVIKLFYGFEIPVLLLLGVFILNLRDYSYGVYWILIWAAFGFLTWFVIVVVGHRKNNRLPFPDSLLAMSGSTILLIIGVFCSIVVSLFLVPFGAIFVKESIRVLSEIKFTSLVKDFRDIDVMSSFGWYVVPIAAIAIFCLTSVLLFLIFPFFVIYIYVGQFWQRVKTKPSVAKVFVSCLVLGVIVSIHFHTGRQDPGQVFNQLNAINISDEAKRNLVDNSEDVRKRLVQAYLGRYQYMSSIDTANLLTRIYIEAFSITDEQALVPQNILNALLRPLLYEGDARADAEKAAIAYEEFFDIPIQKAERKEIVDTLRFNWERRLDNGAGLLDASEEKVYLESQSIDVDVVGSLATITVDQKLVNQTYEDLETVVHFTLPDHAVMTGVWLSEDESNPEHHSFIVAPRGAAQSVYNDQVNRNIDPALLEKVGPQQYRLRVYPVPGLRFQGKNKDPLIIPMYARIQYQSLVDSSDGWPVPKVLEQRNLYWDEQTLDTINGDEFPRHGKGDWIPGDVAKVNTVKRQLTEMSLINGRSVWAIPREIASLQSERSYSYSQWVAKTAVIIDGSRSMETHAEHLTSVIEQLEGATVYFCQKMCKAIETAELDQVVFFGNSSTRTHLKAYSDLVSIPEYDNVLVLTDSGSYELENDEPSVLQFDTPVWVLHMAGDQPYAYPDDLLSAVRQSGGGFGHTGLTELWERAIFTENPQTQPWDKQQVSQIRNADFHGASDAWVWAIERDFDTADTVELPATEATTGLSRLASSLEIARLARREQKSRGSHEPLEFLDELHQIAIQSGVVSEFSSMIVLVNDAQKKALQLAEEEDDRFEREVESGLNSTSVPVDSLSVPAVPEPREWVMMFVILTFLSISYVRRNGFNPLFLSGSLRRI